MKGNKNMGNSNARGCAIAIVGLVLLTPLIILSSLRWYRSYQFDRDIGGHLKRAADSNSLQLADQELTVALRTIESQGLTSGTTTIVFDYPQNDVGFWYANLAAADEKVKAQMRNPNVTDAETTLLKLRQTLLDHNEHGEQVTVPPGISIYPANKFYCFLFWVTGIVGAIGAIMMRVAVD